MNDDAEILQAITESVQAMTKLRDAIGKRRGVSDEHRAKEFEVTGSIAILRYWYKTLADSPDCKYIGKDGLRVNQPAPPAQF
jgi:hypothetical protein